MSRSPEEWMPWPKISYTFWMGQTSNLYTDGARRPTLTFVMTSKLKTGWLLKSPLAGGGGILWQPHCRLHSLLCIVYVCVHIDRAVQKWVGKKYHHKTRLRQCQGEHRIVILLNMYGTYSFFFISVTSLSPLGSCLTGLCFVFIKVQIPHQICRS